MHRTISPTTFASSATSLSLWQVTFGVGGLALKSKLLFPLSPHHLPTHQQKSRRSFLCLRQHHRPQNSSHHRQQANHRRDGIHDHRPGPARPPPASPSSLLLFDRSPPFSLFHHQPTSHQHFSCLQRPLLGSPFVTPFGRLVRSFSPHHSIARHFHLSLTPPSFPLEGSSEN